jgi:hypothetical protein
MIKRMTMGDLLNSIMNNTQPKEITFKSLNTNYESDKYYWDDGCKQYRDIRRGPAIVTIGEKIANDVIVEYNVSILTAQEKQYISNVIKPFRDKVTGIIKLPGESNKEYIEIIFKDGSSISFIDLPPFEKNTMYTGMERSHHYILKELEI